MKSRIQQSAGYLICVMMVALPQIATGQLYRWTDDSGRVIVSDTPPPSGAARKISKGDAGSASSPATTPVTKPSLDPDIAKKVTENEAAEKIAEDKRQSELTEYCESAAQRVSQLASGERISLRDKSGARQIMSNQQRAEELSKLRNRMSEVKCP